MERLVRFTLYGQEFSFYSEASEEEIGRIVELVRREIEPEDGDTRGKVLSNRLAVLAALRIAARYVELERRFADYRGEQDARLREIAARLAPLVESEGSGGEGAGK